MNTIRTQTLERARELAAKGLPGDLTVSFEFFPTKSEEAEKKLWRTVHRLEPLRPDFVSVTCGAGGSTQDRTVSTIKRFIDETSLDTAAHLTCVGTTRDEIDAVARRYLDMGVKRIVALRGDPPEGVERYEPSPEGYAYAADLVEGLKNVGDFDISVAAYPEVHPEAPDGEFDLDNLRRKLDAGADRAITQYFFENDMFLKFRDRAQKAGIDKPIYPGIVPIASFPKIKKFSEMCGATVPDWLEAMFEGLEEDKETAKLVAAGLAAEQCAGLYAEGVRHFHFYTLNEAGLTETVCRMLGILPEDTPATAAA